jgi:hypothetical protein
MDGGAALPMKTPKTIMNVPASTTGVKSTGFSKCASCATARCEFDCFMLS